jgi:hypothetical protein
VEQIELENDERFTVAGIARILDQTERCDAVGAHAARLAIGMIPTP